MRVLTRSLSVFISSQILSTDLLRTNASSSLVSSPGVTEFRALRKSKSYSQFTQTIDRTISFIQDINHTILDVLLFLGQLTKDLYGQNQYLCDIVKLAEWFAILNMQFCSEFLWTENQQCTFLDIIPHEVIHKCQFFSKHMSSKHKFADISLPVW